MKKLFRYIENLWIGDDGKPSIKRILAIAFSVDLLKNFAQAGGAVTKMLKLIADGKTLDPAVVSSISSFLSNEAMIIGAEAALIAGLLSLTTYQSIQLNKPCDPSQGPDPGNIPPHE